MDISQVKAERAALESHMLDRLKAFEARTETRIEHIHLTRLPGGGTHTDKPISEVFVDVEIGRVHEVNA